MQNLLHEQKSNFLKRHASNPIPWQPYSEKAFTLAKELNRPIFLSSGYSSCHWCRTMEKESFEDTAIAEIIAAKFVPVLIDKDEFPDIDKTYQFYIQSLGEAGGWPLNVFLTPDGEPFYAGTYFPPKNTADKPSLKSLLESIHNVFTKKYTEVESVVKVRHDFLKSFLTPQETPLLDRDATNKYIIEEYKKIFDNEFGGFRQGAKFPYIPALLYLTEHANDDEIIAFLVKTANALCSKPICDRLFGGFFRYTADRKWMQPHFEKMLSDNALIPRFLIQMYNLTYDRLYLFTAKNAIDFVIHTMMTEFGLVSSIDADSLNADGALSDGHYYKVTDRDFSVLSAAELANFPNDAGVENGIIYLKSAEYLKAAALAPTLEKTAKRIEMVKEAPMLDNKVIAGTNFLFCTTLLECFESSGEEWYLNQATALFHKIAYILTEGGVVYRCAYGETILNHRTLEDHVYYLEAALKFFELTKEREFLMIAKSITNEIESTFIKNGMIYLDMKHSVVDSFDDDKPNPAALYMYIRNQYTAMLENEPAQEMRRFAVDRMMRFPTGHPTLLRAFKEI